MTDSGIIIWKEQVVGIVTNITSDMWYLEANCEIRSFDIGSMFEQMASNLETEKVIKEPSEGITAVLKFDGQSDGQNVLILSLTTTQIFMRLIVDETAAYINRQFLEPWQQIKDSTPYEIELKKEVSFFHPLKRKRVHAIGKRIDCDDILFEVLDGQHGYAVVHLTWQKESSPKFPITHFYKDWRDVFVNRILKDSKEYIS